MGDADGQKCFILRKGQTSWSDANTRCQNEGDTGLAIITSANENTAVQTAVTQHTGKAYIGLTDSATEVRRRPVDVVHKDDLAVDRRLQHELQPWLDKQPA